MIKIAKYIHYFNCCWVAVLFLQEQNNK